MMEFINKNAELYIPDGKAEGLSKVTDLCIAAHQDDVEIMGYAPIASCYDSVEKSFGAVVCTDGAGSPRIGAFANYTDEDMKKVRIGEQKRAADIGKYGALVLLGYKSGEIKDAENENPEKEIAEILLAARPKRVYIHNFADKHDTHVASALRTLSALRGIKDVYKPEKLYMLEVWRGLDWLCDSDKTLFDASAYPELAKDIINVYESQIAGGKRYDLAAIGRRYANATFYESHSTDSASAVSYGLDATALIENNMTPEEFITAYIENFKSEVSERLIKLSK